MSRKPQIERLETIYRQVEACPGERPAAIARLLGLQRSEVTRALASLEENGYLLCEDPQGRLWPFRRVS